MSTLILLFRKPVPHFFSIEKIFNAISEQLPADMQVKKVLLPHYTSTVKKVWQNMRYVRRQKGNVYHITGDVTYLAMALPKKKDRSHFSRRGIFIPANGHQAMVLSPPVCKVAGTQRRDSYHHDGP